MIEVLAEIPRTKEQWDRWSYANRLEHQSILAAIQAKGGGNLPYYIIEPINFQQFDIFLQNHQQLHLDMTAAVGVQSVDLQDVDLKNESQMVSWIWLHQLDHRNVSEALGI